MKHVKSTTGYEVFVSAACNLDLPDVFYERLGDAVATAYDAGQCPAEGVVDYNAPGISMVVVWFIRTRD